MTFWFEPTDSDEKNGRGKPQYPYNNAKVTASGHSMEMDDTPENERIRIQHRAGSFQEYQATGNVVHKIVGNGYHIIMKDENITISGKCNIIVYGDCEMEVKGDLFSSVGGDAKTTVMGDCETTVKGDYTLTAEGVINLNGSEINLSPVDATYVDSDLNVRGTVTGQQSICSFGNLTAGGHLGVQGSMMITGTVPQMGGPILPHVITGLSLTSVMTTFTSFTSAAATSITSGAATTMKSGAITSITAGGICTIKAPSIFLN